ncbi:MAG TPA: MurR/RpiR family transcriptional regulator, partial [Pseudomonadota bacterium]|nr:MurR/RpiR family transcriptional regulator [Pseudomonadota bacterium]
MSKTVVDQLRANLAQFTATERRVAHQLLADWPMAGLQSATDLARTTGVSTPTVLRLAARLGYASYPGFQKRLREELAAQLSSPLAKSARAPGSGARRAAARGGSEFAEAVIRNLRETFANLPPTELDEAGRLLADRRRRIHLVGGRFTDSLARYVSVQLRVLRPDVSHLQDQESNWQDQLLDMGRRDVLVVFDIRRYQPSLLRLAEGASARGARVVLVTDQWLSPIARVAAHLLPARVVVPSVLDSSAALLALGEALLAEVTRRDWAHSRRRMRDLERLR